MISPKLVVNTKGEQFIKLGRRRYKVKNKRKSDHAILRDILKILKIMNKNKRKQRKRVANKKDGKPVNAKNPVATGSSNEEFIKLLLLKTGTKIEDPFKDKVDKQLEKFDKLLEGPKPQGLLGAPPQVLIDRALAEQELKKKEDELIKADEKLTDQRNLIEDGMLELNRLNGDIKQLKKSVQKADDNRKDAVKRSIIQQMKLIGHDKKEKEAVLRTQQAELKAMEAEEKALKEQEARIKAELEKEGAIEDVVYQKWLADKKEWDEYEKKEKKFLNIIEISSL